MRSSSRRHPVRQLTRQIGPFVRVDAVRSLPRRLRETRNVRSTADANGTRPLAWRKLYAECRSLAAATPEDVKVASVRITFEIFLTCSARPCMPRRMSVCPVAIQTLTPSESESSPRQRLQHARQRRRLDVSPNEDPVAFRKNDFHLAAAFGQFRSVASSRAIVTGRIGIGSFRKDGSNAQLAAPGEQEIGVQLVTSSDLGDRCPS